MTEKNPEISRAEWVLMKLCWRGGAFTARQIYEEAVKKRDWEYQTVKTMLDRLVAKGYLRRQKLGPLCMYEASVPRVSAVERAIEAFAETVLDNALAPWFAHLAKGKKLTDEEMAALRRLLEEQEENGDARDA